MKRLFILCLGWTALALLPAPLGAQPSFPSSVTTNEEKEEWFATELTRSERIIENERAKPIPKQDDAALRQVLSRLVDLLALTDQLPGLYEPKIARERIGLALKRASATLDLLLNSRLKIGMSLDEATKIRGRPKTIHDTVSTSGKTETWHYPGGTVLTFKNGRLSLIEQMRE